MLTRLKVNGFKNLVDVDVRFGPFTCIAGVNAAGKSNLFDAIRFLSLLAEKPLVEAARAVRGSGNRSLDIRSLFTRIGDDYVDEMSFEAEMIIPSEGLTYLGLPLHAHSTYLRYSLRLGYREDKQYSGYPLRILHEQVDTIESESARVPFSHGVEWARSAIQGQGNGGTALLRTRTEPGDRLSWQSATGRHVVGAAVFASFLSLDSDGSDTELALMSREMRSWRVFMLDPSKIGEPDSLLASSPAPTEIGADGSHVAAALHHLAKQPPAVWPEADDVEFTVYARVGNRLGQLVDDIRDVSVDFDPARESLTLQATDRSGVTYAARALSDGTLRFLALAVLELQETPGVYCIEEPENGIHPARIPALLKLLQAIAMDTDFPIEPGNPLRQVIISTHSPAIVTRVPGDSLVVAELHHSMRDGKRFSRATFKGLANTWRDPEPGRHSLALGTLLAYLSPDGYRSLPEPDPERDPDTEPGLFDRADVRRMMSPTPPR